MKWVNKTTCEVGGEGFEPSKSKDNGFTVRPIWPLWYPPSDDLHYLQLKRVAFKPERLLQDCQNWIDDQKRCVMVCKQVEQKEDL